MVDANYQLKGTAPLGKTDPPPKKRGLQAAPPPQPAPAAPPQGPKSLHALKQDPLLGKHLNSVELASSPELARNVLFSDLVDEPIAALRQSYEKARALLTELMYDSESSPQLRAVANTLVTATEQVLRDKNADPREAAAPARDQRVQFQPPRD